ncbi:MAG: sodium/solute symporter [Candidatus Methylacidiphilales bacterium]|nr:sodium/solute symporter [Candidatus Methylacidiphilales bacterium]
MIFRKSMKCVVSLLFAWVAWTASGLATSTPGHDLLKLSKSQIPSASIDWNGSSVGLSGGEVVVVGGWDALQQRARGEAWLAPVEGKGGGWRQVGVSDATAFAAVAQEDAGFICAGGLKDRVPLSTVRRYTVKNGQLTEEKLPDLPVPLAGAGAAVLKGTLYVVGGVTGSSDAVQAETGFYGLDLKKPESGWKTLAPLPGVGKVRPAVVSQYGVVQVFGGYVAGPGGWVASPEVSIFRPVPLEGTMKSGWSQGQPMPVALAGGSAVPVGQAQTLLAGGAEGTVVGWMRADVPAAGPIRLYHQVTDIWAETAVSVERSSARLLARSSGDFLMLGGLSDGSAAEITPIRSVRNLNWLDYLFIVAYFVFIAWIGFYFSARQESSAEFSLGNRKVKWWAAGISMFATGASAISFMAIPALAFATNLIWLFPLVAFIPAYFIQAHLIMPLLRGLEITSTYEYLERRFNKTLRVIACLQCILLQTFGRSSVVLVLPSLAISATTGIDVYLSVLIMGVVTTVYTAIGGFEAVIWTEVFQGLLKFFAPLLMIGICLYNLPGGFGEFLRVGTEHEKFVFALPTLDMAVPGVFLLIFSTFLTATLGAAGDQPIIQRVFSSPLKEVRRVIAMSTACGILIGIIVNFMGLAIFAYFRAHPEQFDAQAQNDQIVPMFVTQALPHGVAGIVIAAIFASAMATVASAMNSVATIYTEDIHPFFKPNADDKNRLLTMKITSYAVGFLGTVIALLLASMNLKSIMVVWSQIVALMGGGVVGVYSLGMFTKRANGFGAVTGVIASVVVTFLVKGFTPLHWATYLPIAIITCVGVGYAASFLSSRQKADLTGLTVFTPAVKAPAA